ncbi:hypothetical protein [Saccharolobus solfataricus]|uniref:Uncharacterized protein n=1 Tax=Saccharolobus solfataricus (strain 98/2) TaxID=555311 RepID=D0KNI2_SACS9|nr:hypothetical protein [Saccharolobus solfataricus]
MGMFRALLVQPNIPQIGQKEIEYNTLDYTLIQFLLINIISNKRSM